MTDGTHEIEPTDAAAGRTEFALLCAMVIDELGYAAYNLCEKTESDVGEGVIESTCPEATLFLAIRKLRLLQDKFDQSIFEAKREEAKKIHSGISDLIKKGDLPGDGRDKTAERNGLILAANYVHAYGT